MAKSVYVGWHRVLDWMAYVENGKIVKIFRYTDPEMTCTFLEKPCSIQSFKNKYYYRLKQQKERV